MKENLLKKTTVCFGDSNTHGYDSSTGGRFDDKHRYPCLLEQYLGEGYLVREEGMSGRTTVFELTKWGLAVWKNPDNRLFIMNTRPRCLAAVFLMQVGFPVSKCILAITCISTKKVIVCWRMLLQKKFLPGFNSGRNFYLPIISLDQQPHFPRQQNNICSIHPKPA